MADTRTDADVMLRMTGICKSFGGLEVLRGIDLSLTRGEVLAIIGPSGSGKSTLLRCINKLETIDRGNITIRGEKLCWTNPDGTTATYASTNDVRRILMSTGMVFQQFNLLVIPKWEGIVVTIRKDNRITLLVLYDWSCHCYLPESDTKSAT